MTTAAPALPIPDAPATSRSSDALGTRALNGAATFWWGVMILGQWVFVYYLIAFYGVTTFTGNMQAWSANQMAPNAYRPGDTAGNVAFAAHALLAAIIAFGGTVQLVPQIRQRWIAVHRWNGRIFLTAAFAASVAGLYMLWFRKQQGLGGLSLTLDALLIFVFGTLAWRAARAKDATTHRRWALRALVATNGVWFMRAGFMAWVAVQQGPVAMKTFFEFWQWLAYLLPLGLLELYMYARDKGTAREKLAVAGTLSGLTLLMALGIVVLFMGMLFPILAKI